jgi:GMP synthase (glutamine-hydrolysing)
MTARAFPFDNEFLSKCATRIINEVDGGKFFLAGF